MNKDPRAIPIQHRVIFIMGVSGSGKTTVGKLLATATGFTFYDGDEFHPAANKTKMQNGIALSDEDREPWLTAIHFFVKETIQLQSIIIACSALKNVYRATLSNQLEANCSWVYLMGSYDTILQRMQHRSDHYMPVALLSSQFDLIEEPLEALKLDIEESPENLVASILLYLNLYMQAFGLVGLGVMGKSLSRNLARNGVSLSLYNRFVPIAEEQVALRFIKEYPELHNAKGFEQVVSFVASLALPRKIFLMVPAGEAVDTMIGDLLPYLSAGDILIDGGNSFYKDTERRVHALAEKNIHFIGTGVSGGEEGALKGPSIMPGGDLQAYQLVAAYLEKIAAQNHLGPCCSYIGKGGAGHFVKMVHNGIEYAEMQLIAEVFDVLRNINKLTPDEIALVFASALNGPLHSYLLEITIPILQKKEGNLWLIDAIVDKAGNKGTGGWTTTAAAELGVPVPTLTAALFARYQSEMKLERVTASTLINAPNASSVIEVDELLAAYQLARIINHHQGFQLIKAASDRYEWNIPMAQLAAIWTNGCIIRSTLMETIALLFAADPEKPILLQESIRTITQEHLPALSTIGMVTSSHSIPTPCLSSAAQFIYGYIQANSSANLIQAQRDYFGAHTYKRKDDAAGKSYHTNWDAT